MQVLLKSWSDYPLEHAAVEAVEILLLERKRESGV